MYQIGEFSKLCKTTIKTLRYYEKIDLLKPIEINNYTGYRYYDKSQIEIVLKIKTLQESDFSLKEIKDILNNNNISLLNKKELELKQKYYKQLDTLEKEKKNMENYQVELITTPEITYIGYFKKIKNRKEISKIQEKYLDDYFSIYNKNVYIPYEKGYKDNNITCFIGKVIDNKTFVQNHLKKKKLCKSSLSDGNHIKTMLHIKTKDIEKGYKEIIKYAEKNNIQIREPYIEIYQNIDLINKNIKYEINLGLKPIPKEIDEYTDIYVEAYDLNIEDEITLKVNNNILNSKERTYEKKYIGTWILKGEEIGPSFLNHITDKPDTILKEITLNSDGTTNFNNITWYNEYLIIEEDNIKFVNYIYVNKSSTKLKILINQKESNSRPYQYIYKRKRL